MTTVNGMTLIEWLRVQLDVDQEIAQAAIDEVGDGQWEQRRERIVTSADQDREVADYAIVECIDHIVAWDPARVLAEVKAKRAILDGFEASYRQSDDYPGWEGAVYAIAQPYRGRDGWQDEWSVSE